MTLATATRLGPYEIIAPLGGGSMGEVYVARDPRLHRKVALKVISEHGSQDATRRRRFVQEARAASSLNHPNILVIHDFGTNDGISYIVSELVEGTSLRELIHTGPLPIRQLLDIAVQIADGLAAAHDAGIVHRDLKPENIMLTPGHRVKILDFGLAKPVVANDGSLDADILSRSTEDGGPGGTQPGLILGTVGYMSPEQALGRPVSYQSDQFALGIVLHEMATGQHPFRRSTPMETLMAIANVSRPPFTPGPVAFRMLVSKCLARDPADRFASTAALRDKLAHVRDELQASAPVRSWWRALLSRIRVPKKVWYGVAAAALACAIAIAAVNLAPRSPAPDLARYEYMPVTAEAGVAALPAFSPDGQRIAYAGADNGVLQIFVRARDGSGSSVQLTHAAQDCLYPFWSHDGSAVYYVSGEKLWSASTAGGAPNLISGNVLRAAQSRDGHTTIVLRRDAGRDLGCSLWLWKTNSPPQPLANERVLENTFFAFSPDSRKVAVWAQTERHGSQVWVVDTERAGSAQQANVDTSNIGGARPFAWFADSRHIVFAAPGSGTPRDHLWIANMSSGSLHEITTGTGSEQTPTVSPGGGHIAFASAIAQPALRAFSASPDAPAPSLPSQTQFPSSSPAWSPAGAQYAYVTWRSGAPEIRMRDARSGWERTIVSHAAFSNASWSLSHIAFSPDGQRIAFERAAPDSTAIWITGLNGDTPSRLTDSNEVQHAPSWSPDGNWIVYSTVRDGNSVLLKARPGSSAKPMVVAVHAGERPQWSPHGDVILSLSRAGLLLSPAAGGQSRVIANGEWVAAAWAKAPNTVFGLTRAAAGHLALVRVNVVSGARTEVVDAGEYPPLLAGAFGSAGDVAISVSNDGKTVLASVPAASANIWLLRGFAL